MRLLEQNRTNTYCIILVISVKLQFNNIHAECCITMLRVTRHVASILFERTVLNFRQHRHLSVARMHSSSSKLLLLSCIGESVHIEQYSCAHRQDAGSDYSISLVFENKCTNLIYSSYAMKCLYMISRMLREIDIILSGFRNSDIIFCILVHELHLKWNTSIQWVLNIPAPLTSNSLSRCTFYLIVTQYFLSLSAYFLGVPFGILFSFCSMIYKAKCNGFRAICSIKASKQSFRVHDLKMVIAL